MWVLVMWLVTVYSRPHALAQTSGNQMVTLYPLKAPSAFPLPLGDL